jgi:hypothetical protein
LLNGSVQRSNAFVKPMLNRPQKLVGAFFGTRTIKKTKSAAAQRVLPWRSQFGNRKNSQPKRKQRRTQSYTQSSGFRAARSTSESIFRIFPGRRAADSA